MEDKQVLNYHPISGPGIGRPPKMHLARAYVPWQRFGRTYSPREALMRGTLFPELFWPYEKYYR